MGSTARCGVLLLLLALAQVCFSQGSESGARKELSVGSLKATLSGGAQQRTFSASFPKVAFQNVELDDKSQLELTFDVKSNGEAFKPQQAMLVLRSASGGAVAQLVARARKGAAGYAVLISVAAVEKQAGRAGGSFAASLLIGDPSAPAGVRWELGTLSLPSRGDAVPVVTASTQPSSFTKPEIHHAHRPAAKTPQAAVSMAFTGLAVAPLAAVLLATLRFGFNIKGFPTGGGAVWAAAFHAGIAALLALYAAFWLRLTLVQTLPPAIAIGLFTAAAGYRALSAVADARLKRGLKRE